MIHLPRLHSVRAAPAILLVALLVTAPGAGHADPGFSNPHDAACVPGVAPELCQAAQRLRSGKPEAARTALEEVRVRFLGHAEQRYAFEAIDFSVQLAEATSGRQTIGWQNGKPMGAAIGLEKHARQILDAWLAGPREDLPFLPSPYLPALGLLSGAGEQVFTGYADPMLAAARLRRAEDPEGVVAFTRSLAWSIFVSSHRVAIRYLESAMEDLDASSASKVSRATLELDVALVYCQVFSLTAYTEAMVRTARALELLRTTAGVPFETHERLLGSAAEQVERSRLGLRMKGDVTKLAKLREKNLATIAALRGRGPVPSPPPLPGKTPPPEQTSDGWLGR